MLHEISLFHAFFQQLLHFHLHLSSIGASELSSALVYDRFHGAKEEKLKKVDSCEPLIVQDDTKCQNKMVGAYPALPPVGSQSRISQKIRLESPVNCKKNSGKQFRRGSCEDVSNAVELAVAASEALTISELFNSGEILQAKSILEVALRVKQARNEYIADALGVEIDECDHLSELDEETMADAYEDVGISCTQVVVAASDHLSHACASPIHKGHTNHCDLDIKQARDTWLSPSRVLDTQISESYHGRDEVVQNNKPKVQVAVCTAVMPQHELYYMEHQPKEIAPNSATLQQMRSFVPEPLDLDGLSRRCLLEHPHQAVCNGTDVLKFNKFPSEEANIILEGGEDNLHNNQNVTNAKPNFFTGDMSFFSESLDVFVDEKSSVQQPGSGREVAASSYTPFEHMIDTDAKINENIYDDLVRSSPSVDPLCSVVPCSISSGDNSNITGLCLNNMKEKSQKYLNPVVESDDLHNRNEQTMRISTEKVVSLMTSPQEKEFVPSKFNDEGSGGIIRRQLSSLKTYSKLIPAQHTGSSGDVSVYNETVLPMFLAKQITQFLPCQENVDCPMDSNMKKSSGFPSLPSARFNKNNLSHDKFLDSKKHENTNAVFATRKPFFDPTNQELRNLQDDRNGDEDIELLSHQQEKVNSPLVLNFGIRRRLRASSKGSIGDDGSTTSSVPKVCENDAGRFMSNADLRVQTDGLSYFPLHSNLCSNQENANMSKKRVRFSEADIKIQSNTSCKLRFKHQTHKNQSQCRKFDTRMKATSSLLQSRARGNGHRSFRSCCTDGRRMIFQGLEFLLTGFSGPKEKELKDLIRKHGGVVLSGVPSPSLNLKGNRELKFEDLQLPVVLSPRKVQTTKFLYGCATNASVLTADWVTDSIEAGTALRHSKYLILPYQAIDRMNFKSGQLVHCSNYSYIFDGLGFMLYGRPSFCTKFSKVIKHGGGQIFKNLKWLAQSLETGQNSAGAIVVEDESNASRHLKHCASEHNLQTMPANWIVNSLFLGKLLPLKKDRSAPLRRIKKPIFPQPHHSMDMSQEI
ncbi:hypothetical protein QJS04_geneDACA003612 [Acorus gramineus]|uniref:BRCT domain-containing protein n=1 Tax=Acorus gramineus TaxID=55184 RepID=A0AAV9BLP7_ACOGR|nr:hypothetical protein QJS04_geneDACA003612 [Acorus gramineus]